GPKMPFGNADAGESLRLSPPREADGAAVVDVAAVVAAAVAVAAAAAAAAVAAVAAAAVTAAAVTAAASVPVAAVEATAVAAAGTRATAAAAVAVVGTVMGENRVWCSCSALTLMLGNASDVCCDILAAELVEFKDWVLGVRVAEEKVSNLNPHPVVVSWWDSQRDYIQALSSPPRRQRKRGKEDRSKDRSARRRLLGVLWGLGKEFLVVGATVEGFGSSGGELMLYRAILMDTGANCNIISIAVVRRLGLTVYEASTGAKVTRRDNSPTKFTHYCHVDVILAAGTPHMTLHRLHAFVTFEPDNSWDLLVGTGPLKNSLMIDIKLGSGVAVSHAPSVLGMDTQVILPQLVDMTPPKRPTSVRRVDPIVCLTTEIFGPDLGKALGQPCGRRVSGPYRWKNQRLYRDKNDTARLCCIVKHHDLAEAPSLEHVPVEFARCGEQKWVREDQLRWPDWLSIDQKMYQDEENDKWMFRDSYTTHIPSNKRDVVYPRRTGPMIDNSKLRMLQDKVKELQKYPSGEVTGILMWDLSKRVFCVQPESATQYIDLMQSTLDHAAVYNSEELLQELQFPHWYESAGVWEYQLLRYLQPVDMPLLRDGLYQAWLRDGQNRPPLELVKLEPKPVKFYPVDDGLGGGKVFADNASAQEYLHLGEGRKMLRRDDTRESGRD
ncbi:hypothetical protein CYMTET_37463, partial [Cymbomonas tetramitiformis]